MRLSSLMLRMSIPAACLLTAVAGAQTETPVYVDDSPRAWELVQRAADQAERNQGEAVRLYQELLDDYAYRLVPRRDRDSDLFVDVRRRVTSELLDDETLLDRYQLVHSAEATRLLEAGELRRLAYTRSLTPAGLEALLRLAQQAFESARFHTALHWLEEAAAHPNLDNEAAIHCWFMRALSAHHLGDRVFEMECRRQLAAAGPAAEPFLDEIDRLAEDTPPHVPGGISPLDQSTTEDLSDLVGQTIWSFEYGRVPSSQAAADVFPPSRFVTQPGRRGAAPNTSATRATATITDNAVLVNDGEALHALDRFTARELWSSPYRDRAVRQGEDALLTGAVDLGLISVRDRDLVAIVGQPGADRISRTGVGRLVCLDILSGRPRWELSLDRLFEDEEFEGLFPHGQPIIGEGMVYVLSRKITNEKLMGTYVVAVDLVNGAPRWIRHLASSGAKSVDARAFSTLVMDRSNLYVASAIGVVASIDAPSGAVRWLHRAPVPTSSPTSRHEPWEVGGPIVVDDRVIALSPDQNRIDVRDRNDGVVIGTHDARTTDRWNRPAYLLADARNIYAIGEQVRVFSRADTDFRSPTWSIPPRTRERSAIEDEPFGEAPAPDTFPRVTLAGRVQLAGDSIIVPDRNSVLIVDAETGTLVNQLRAEQPGNPVAMGSQLVLAMPDGVTSYMSLTHAEQMIRERIARAPDDPEPALSLLQLGIRVEALSLALEAADLALTALDQGSDERAAAARNELFTMLLEVHARRMPTSVEDGDALYSLIGRVASDGAQRVEHLIAHGDWLADFAPERSIDRFQAILEDSVLAATVRNEAGILRPAGAWAGRRIGAVIRKFGATQYAAADARAASALAVSTNDAIGEVRLASIFPFSPAALQAGCDAARRLSTDGRQREALAGLTSAYRVAATPERASVLIGAYIDICMQGGRDDLALSALQSITRRHGDITLQIGDARIATDAMYARLDQSRFPAPRGSELSGTFRDLPGRLVTGLTTTTPLPDDRFVLQDEGRIVMYGSELKPAWSAPCEEQSLRVLAWTPKQLLLWSADGVGRGSRDPRVLAFDPTTGKELWTTPRIGLFIDPPIAGGDDRMRAGGRSFRADETLVRFDTRNVFLIQRTGGIVAFDRRDGAQARWFTNRTLDTVVDAVLAPDGLTLVGEDRPTGPGTVTPAPRLLTLDPADGSVITRARPRTGDAILWALDEGLGGLVIGTTAGIELLDVITGRMAWANLEYESADTREAWAGPRSIVVRDRVDGLRRLDPIRSDISLLFDFDVFGDWQQRDLADVRIAPDQVLAHYRERLIMYDHDGEVIGADIVGDDRQYDVIHVANEGMYAVSLADRRQDRRNGRNVILYTYRLYRFSGNGRVEGEVLEIQDLEQSVNASRLINDWLLISTGDRTIAFDAQR